MRRGLAISKNGVHNLAEFGGPQPPFCGDRSKVYGLLDRLTPEQRSALVRVSQELANRGRIESTRIEERFFERCRTKLTAIDDHSEVVEAGATP